MKYKIKWLYVPGSNMYIADTLSRAYVENEVEQQEEDRTISSCRTHLVSAHYPTSPQKLAEVKDATRGDATSQKLRKYT